MAVGRTFGLNAGKGDVFALAGDLGAGKTQFVKGFVAGLESSADVTSPTFVLVHEYGGGRLPVYHFDFYRLENRDAILRLGFDDYVFGDGVSLDRVGRPASRPYPEPGEVALVRTQRRKYTVDHRRRAAMKMLAFELSSGQGSIALVEDGEALFERSFPNDRKDSGAFFENVKICLQQFGAPGEIVVGLGPGSYAGVRIAIASAVGLRTAVGAKLGGLASICALEVEERDYCVIGDARRQSFYLARVSDGRLIEGPTLMIRSRPANENH